MRAGFRALLEKITGIEVVGEASSGTEALEQITALEPDVVLMDISMPGLNGLEAVRRLAKLKPRPRVLMLSMHDEKEYVRQALQAGASGYLLQERRQGRARAGTDGGVGGRDVDEPVDRLGDDLRRSE